MSLMPMLAGGIKFRGRGVIVARPRRFPLGLQTGLSPPCQDAYQSTIFSPVTWAAIAFTKSS